MNVCITASGRKPTSLTTLAIALSLLVGLPLVGAITMGHPVDRYLEFPPLTRYVRLAGFSWPVFLSIAVLILLTVGSIVARILRSQTAVEIPPASKRPFPWWGWAGLVWFACAWLLAWSRFDWFAPLQHHTFTPLWLGYIVVINALIFKRRGNCLLVERPGYLALLFVISAVFWWYFEYLNRFVQNWYYAGIVDFTSLEYVFFATLSFSTVLPAVISTRDLLASFPRLSAGLDRFVIVRTSHPCRLASLVLILSVIGLANISREPDYLFPLLWVAPLLIITCLQTLRGETQVFRHLADGDWRDIWLAAIAALVCGFFWEMWNYYSLAHWQYAVPLVQRFHLFEMPLLGYAGYLPFGIECLIIARISDRILSSKSKTITRKRPEAK